MQQAYKEAIKAFYDAGCRYLQIDDVYWGRCVITLVNRHLKPIKLKRWRIFKPFLPISRRFNHYHPPLQAEATINLLIY
ncbi:hypothetical protein INT82_12275 [Mannheimia haemolytica]|nr:hypothetical protein [Mannheimia haemolytica]